MSRPRVLLARGHHATPWNLRPWEELTGDYDVAVLLTGSNAYDLERTDLPRVQVGALRDKLPRGRIGDVIAGVAGDRYLGADEHLAGADIVHAEELSFWFSGELARLKPRFRYRLALTVWET